MNTYEAVRNAVRDFLQIHGEINALNLANLVGNMSRIEKGALLHKNETDFYRNKQDLGEFSNFWERIGSMKQVRTARQILAVRACI